MKEKTKEMADQVGAVYPILLLGRHDGVLFTETELETFVELVAAHKAEVTLAESYRCGHEAGAVAEREACAELVEPDAEHRSNSLGYLGGAEGIDLLDGIAAAIRARGNP